MSTVGIIAEYNPLHNGHVHHFREAKRLSGASRSIVVMSGPFTQRGEPAAVSKRTRTEMALRMGADLVIELPVAYAVQPAEWFAFGAVALLEATGVVSSLCFGSESGSLSQLLPLARFLAEESAPLQGEIRRRLALGESFPAAYSAAAALVWRDRLDEGGPVGVAAGAEGPSGRTAGPADMSGAGAGSASPMNGSGLEDLLRGPNNSLGLHYLIALRRLGSGIVPLTVPRLGAGFHEPLRSGASIASATALRGLLREGGSLEGYMPEYSLSVLRREQEEGRGPLDWESFRSPLLHLLSTRSAAELGGLLDVGEGLENRLLRIVPELERFTVDGLLSALKSKRYTRTRLQRMLLHILLNHGKEEFSPGALSQGPGYIRVLGFRESGRTLLKKMKQSASLPVILRPALCSHPQLTRDLQASAAYAAAFASPLRSDLYSDYLKPPVMV
ncbi:tRNA(Met) cytidine acetate ligase [Paenibacillus rhizophilus]|uniref:tRNA(Met) cytidine acetate ligase n=1 Tax=Paenibacillus rhizophilus TaxID=1850366 RepID=A0A3N9PBP4_9BACL|nr:nucleotidyltransferase family protein [Paenibacillus rhizophilus]RQW13663.1 nucleotidyltransferase [Paenibacillus rhizophilus]